MSRKRTIEQTLLELARPIGPFGTPEYRLLERDEWLNGLDEVDLPELLAILDSPPAELVSDPSLAEAFEHDMSEALVAAGRREPLLLLALLERLLRDPRAGARSIARAALEALREHPVASEPEIQREIALALARARAAGAI